MEVECGKTTAKAFLIGALVLFVSLISSVFLRATPNSAAITLESRSNVQFTFNPTITLSLSDTSSDCPTPPYVAYSASTGSTFCIENLAPGGSKLSNTVRATVSTNSSIGYTLSATVGGTGLDGTSTFTNNNLELPGTGSTPADVFTMISPSATSLSAGYWGYTLDGGTTYGSLPYNDPTDPTVIPTVLNKTIDNAGTGYTGYTGTSNTDIQIGAYADSTQLSGAYQNVINFTALANIQTRNVTIARENTDVVSYNIVSVDGNAITPTTTGSYNDGQVLGIEAVCATQISFRGWSISQEFGHIANTDAATTTYTVGGNDVILTAHCGITYVGDMQDVTASMCTSDPAAASDSRDGKRYIIARLDDDQCWMVSNLNLAGGTELYSETSDVPSGYSISDGNYYYKLPDSNITGFNNTSGAYVYNSGNETGDQSGCTSTQACNSYYSWLAATAGGKNANNASVVGDGVDASYSICPKGWRLPKSGSTNDSSATSSVGYKKGDFYKLASHYGLNSTAYLNNHSNFPALAGPGTTPNFLFAGSISSSGYGNIVSGSGLYQSSSSKSSTYNYYFFTTRDGNLVTAGNTGRSSGLSVRCVLR